MTVQNDSDKTVLVVEDDDTLRLLIVKQLKKLGFEADVSTDGADALNKLKNKDYVLVLMDIQMPKMDGFEATAAIRELERSRDVSRIPIIAVTANPERDRCVEHGMDDFVFKPVMINQLHDVLTKWLPMPSSKSPRCN